MTVAHFPSTAPFFAEPSIHPKNSGVEVNCLLISDSAAPADASRGSPGTVQWSRPTASFTDSGNGFIVWRAGQHPPLAREEDREGDG